MKKIAVINYGMGNLHSVVKGLQKAGVPAVLTASAATAAGCRGIIIPGVGAFKDAVRELKKRKLFGFLKKAAEKNKPIMGICLGMQLLFKESLEFGRTKGLDIIDGKVEKFKKGLKIPHMGWNRADFTGKGGPVLKGLKSGEFFYFVHSYYAMPVSAEPVLTKTKYGNIIFTSGVRKGNVYGFQFHPEKSGEKGLRIYKNFYRLALKAGGSRGQ